MCSAHPPQWEEDKCLFQFLEFLEGRISSRESPVPLLIHWVIPWDETLTLVSISLGWNVDVCKHLTICYNIPVGFQDKVDEAELALPCDWMYVLNRFMRLCSGLNLPAILRHILRQSTASSRASCSSLVGSPTYRRRRSKYFLILYLGLWCTA